DTATPGQARVANKIVSGLKELRRMADDMLGFAAGTRCARQPVTILELLRDVRDTVDGQLSPSSTIAVSVTDEDLQIVANRDAIKGALLNLVNNADQATDLDCNILLHAHRFGDSIHLCVTDNGPGITRDVQARLFEPFFTTRSNGTGLGLAVVQAVAAAHDGDVELHTSELGSSFSIRLPAQPRSGDAL
ncbi:MAG: HAMP domain-containing sensor histidine kinase, partial [Pseudomonadota bacterium]